MEEPSSGVLPPLPSQRGSKWSPLGVAVLSLFCNPLMIPTFIACGRAARELGTLKTREALGHWEPAHAQIRNQAVWAILLSVVRPLALLAMAVGIVAPNTPMGFPSKVDGPFLATHGIPTGEWHQVRRELLRGDDAAQALAVRHVLEMPEHELDLDGLAALAQEQNISGPLRALLIRRWGVLSWGRHTFPSKTPVGSPINLHIDQGFLKGPMVEAWLDAQLLAGSLTPADLNSVEPHVPSPLLVGSILLSESMLPDEANLTDDTALGAAVSPWDVRARWIAPLPANTTVGNGVPVAALLDAALQRLAQLDPTAEAQREEEMASLLCALGGLEDHFTPHADMLLERVAAGRSRLQPALICLRDARVGRFSWARPILERERRANPYLRRAPEAVALPGMLIARRLVDCVPLDVDAPEPSYECRDDAWQMGFTSSADYGDLGGLPQELDRPVPVASAIGEVP